MGVPNSTDRPAIKWIVTVGVPIVTVALSVFALIQSCASNRFAQEGNDVARTAEAHAQEGNDIARTAEAHNATQDAQQLIAIVEVKTLIARSPDLMASEDRDFWETAQLVPNPIKSPYWRSEAAAYEDTSRKGYVFIIIQNHGPGTVKNMKVSEIRLAYKQGEQPPPGVYDFGDLGVLPSKQFYAILVDVVEPIQSGTKWRRTDFDLSKAHYEWVYMKLVYEDTLKPNNLVEILLGNNPQIAVPTPWEAQRWSPLP